MNYKIKTTTNLDKVFIAYAKRKGINATSLRFYVDGTRVNYGREETPETILMENGVLVCDQIDVMLEQQGC